jgi:hypothetical protein
MPPKRRLLLYAVIAVSGMFSGCSIIPYYSTVEGLNDAQWLDGEMRVVANRSHYVDSMFSFESHSRLERQEWVSAEVTFPNRPVLRAHIHKLSDAKGEVDRGFLAINGSGLLIHQEGGQCALFDPGSGKDVSKTFPIPLLFNRSHTAYLSLVAGKAVIFDTLSAIKGEPAVLARPPWTVTPEQIHGYGKAGGLTDDVQYLVLFSGGTVEAWSTNGTKEQWVIPAERSRENLVDAESIDGKVAVLSRSLILPYGSHDAVKLTTMDGVIVCSGEIAASDGGGLWNPRGKAILFVPYGFSPLASERSSQIFELWNYSLNTVQSTHVWN